MIFSSLEFLCVFFPIHMLLYYLAKNIRVKNIVLLICSMLFYIWGEPTFFILLLLMVLINWSSALFIEKFRNRPAAKISLTVSCALSLSLLGFFKYTAFFLRNIQVVFGIPHIIPGIVLPIGISFYTFQLLSYTIDVYRKEVPAQKSFRHVLLYTCLFHQCIAGPIVRYKDVMDEILDRHADFKDISQGMNRFAVGLGKKVLLANVCGSISDNMLIPADIANDITKLSENLSTLSSRSALALWLGVFAFMLQIYLDFSAYSDMAIGMGRMIGFHYKENFNYPYISKSITEFWRRWHISLGTFFRDYLYIPLGGNRKGQANTIRNLFIVWLLTGLWHGASWNFVLWGLFFFILIMMERLFLKKALEKIPVFFSHVYVLFTVFFGWILFRNSNLSFILPTIRGLFGLNGNALTDFETNRFLLNHIYFLMIAVLAVTPLFAGMVKWVKMKTENLHFARSCYMTAEASLPAIIMFLSIVSLTADSYNPFLYYQF